MNDNRTTGDSTPFGDRWPFEVSTSDFQAQATGTQAARTADLYAVAWTLAQRDHELDKLFNAAYYYEI